MIVQLEELVERIRKGKAEPSEILLSPDTMREVIREYETTFKIPFPQKNFVHTIKEIPVVPFVGIAPGKVYVGFRMEVKRDVYHL